MPRGDARASSRGTSHWCELSDRPDGNDLAVLHLVAVYGRRLELTRGIPLVVLAQAVLVVRLDPGQEVCAGGLARVDAREQDRRCVVTLDRVRSRLQAERRLVRAFER